MKFKEMAAYAAARAKEPSTLAAVSAVAAVFGYHVDPGMAQTVLSIVAVASASVAAARKG